MNLGVAPAVLVKARNFTVSAEFAPVRVIICALVVDPPAVATVDGVISYGSASVPAPEANAGTADI